MRTNSRRGVIALGFASAAAVLWPHRAAALPALLGGYAVDGKKGKFVDQAGKRKLDQSGGADTTASLGSDAVNRGEYQEALLNLPGVTGFVKKYLADIAAQWPHVAPKDIPIRIVGSRDYCATALPDNSITVNLGMLSAAQTDEEVAYILAHEYSHIVLGHLAKNGAIQKQRQLIGALTRVYSQGVELSEARVIKAGDSLLVQPGDRKKIEKAQAQAAAASQRLRFIVNVLVEPNWSRKQEDESDALAFDLSSHKFAAIAGSQDVFDRLEALRTKRKALAEELQEQLNKSLAETMTEENIKAALAGEGESVMSGFWKSFQRGLREQGKKVVTTLLSAKHRPPEDRRKGLDGYMEHAYPGPRAMKDSSTAYLAQIKALKEFKDASTAVEAVANAIELRIAGDFPGAAKAVMPALKTPFSATPLVANEAGRIFAAVDNFNESERWFTLAHASPNQSLSGYRDHVAMLLKARRWPRASQVVAKGITYVKGDRKPFLPALITIAFATGKNEEGVALLEECIKHENPELKQECVTSGISPAEKEKYDKLPPEMKARIDTAMLKASDTGKLTSSTDALGKTFQGFMAVFDKD